MKRLSTFIAATVIAASSSFAADVTTKQDDPFADYACGTQVKGVKADVVAAIADGTAWSSPSGFTGRPFIVWKKDGPFPTVKLASQTRGGGWMVWAIESGSAVQGAYATPQGRVMILTMHSVEGPGSQFVSFSSSDGAISFVCGEVDFPKALNSPDYRGEYLELKRLEGNDTGAIRLITASAAARSSRIATYYSFQTGDGGKTWGDAVGSDTEPEATKGTFEALTQGVSASILSALPERF